MSYYFTNDETLKSEVKTINVMINNLPFSFYTDNGVFSKKGLDFGTRTLLENLPDLKGNILDIGCGYGPIGIYISKKNNLLVDMIDVNLRALNLAHVNASLNKVDVNIFESDIYSNVDKKYDYIITNPPIRVGKKILYEILIKAKDYLKKDGHLIFVINKDQGAKSTMKDMQEYYSVNLLEKNKGFYVIDCQNH